MVDVLCINVRWFCMNVCIELFCLNVMAGAHNLLRIKYLRRYPKW